MNNNTLYAAYGSNLNLRQMSVRCPDAVPVGTAMLKDWQLTFRGVATLEPSEGAETPIGIWEITPQCERNLDLYEGFPSYYGKREVTVVDGDGREIKAMVYVMTPRYDRPALPSESYYNGIADGFEQNGIPTETLEAALEETYRIVNKPHRRMEVYEYATGL